MRVDVTLAALKSTVESVRKPFCLTEFPASRVAWVRASTSTSTSTQMCATRQLHSLSCLHKQTHSEWANMACSGTERKDGCAMTQVPRMRP